MAKYYSFTDISTVAFFITTSAARTTFASVWYFGSLLICDLCSRAMGWLVSLRIFEICTEQRSNCIKCVCELYVVGSIERRLS